MSPIWETLDNPDFHRRVADGMLLASLPTFLTLTLLLDAPWGKTSYNTATRTLSTRNTPSARWLGPLLSSRLCWFLMELPNLIWSLVCLVRRHHHNHRMDYTMTPYHYVVWGMFVTHYSNRAILYPLRQSVHSQRMPLSVALAAWVFTNVNGYLQGQNTCRFLVFCDSHTEGQSSFGWFSIGLLLFVLGMSINLQSDRILRNLRSANQGYQIPRGGLFDYCSTPHYFGELVEWTGFAIACMNTGCSTTTISSSSSSTAVAHADNAHGSAYPAWVFVIYTASNLIPRGMSHHKWYNQKFEDYPNERTAVIPFLL